MAGHGEAIPYADIDTVFLDVGNTLISIDWDDLDCPVARHLTEVADALAATRV